LHSLLIHHLSVGTPLCCEAEPKAEAKDDDKKHDLSVDRTTVIPVETSMKYLKSEGMYYKY